MNPESFVWSVKPQTCSQHSGLWLQTCRGISQGKAPEMFCDGRDVCSDSSPRCSGAVRNYLNQGLCRWVACWTGVSFWVSRVRLASTYLLISSQIIMVRRWAISKAFAVARTHDGTWQFWLILLGVVCERHHTWTKVNTSQSGCCCLKSNFVIRTEFCSGPEFFLFLSLAKLVKSIFAPNASQSEFTRMCSFLAVWQTAKLQIKAHSSFDKIVRHLPQ